MKIINLTLLLSLTLNISLLAPDELIPEHNSDEINEEAKQTKRQREKSEESINSSKFMDTRKKLKEEQETGIKKPEESQHKHLKSNDSILLPLESEHETSEQKQSRLKKEIDETKQLMDKATEQQKIITMTNNKIHELAEDSIREITQLKEDAKTLKSKISAANRTELIKLQEQIEKFKEDYDDQKRKQEKNYENLQKEDEETNKKYETIISLITENIEKIKHDFPESEYSSYYSDFDKKLDQTKESKKISLQFANEIQSKAEEAKRQFESFSEEIEDLNTAIKVKDEQLLYQQNIKIEQERQELERNKNLQKINEINNQLIFLRKDEEFNSFDEQNIKQLNKKYNEHTKITLLTKREANQLLQEVNNATSQDQLNDIKWNQLKQAKEEVEAANTEKSDYEFLSDLKKDYHDKSQSLIKENSQLDSLKASLKENDQATKTISEIETLQGNNNSQLDRITKLLENIKKTMESIEVPTKIELGIAQEQIKNLETAIQNQSSKISSQRSTVKPDEDELLNLDDLVQLDSSTWGQERSLERNDESDETPKGEYIHIVNGQEVSQQNPRSETPRIDFIRLQQIKKEIDDLQGEEAKKAQSLISEEEQSSQNLFKEFSDIKKRVNIKKLSSAEFKKRTEQIKAEENDLKELVANHKALQSLLERTQLNNAAETEATSIKIEENKSFQDILAQAKQEESAAITRQQSRKKSELQSAESTSRSKEIQEYNELSKSLLDELQKEYEKALEEERELKKQAANKLKKQTEKRTKKDFDTRKRQEQKIKKDQKNDQKKEQELSKTEKRRRTAERQEAAQRQKQIKSAKQREAAIEATRVKTEKLKKQSEKQALRKKQREFKDLQAQQRKDLFKESTLQREETKASEESDLKQLKKSELKSKEGLKQIKNEIDGLQGEEAKKAQSLISEEEQSSQNLFKEFSDIKKRVNIKELSSAEFKKRTEQIKAEENDLKELVANHKALQSLLEQTQLNNTAETEATSIKAEENKSFQDILAQAKQEESAAITRQQSQKKSELQSAESTYRSKEIQEYNEQSKSLLDELQKEYEKALEDDEGENASNDNPLMQQTHDTIIAKSLEESYKKAYDEALSEHSLRLKNYPVSVRNSIIDLYKTELQYLKDIHNEALKRLTNNPNKSSAIEEWQTKKINSTKTHIQNLLSEIDQRVKVLDNPQVTKNVKNSTLKRLKEAIKNLGIKLKKIKFIKPIKRTVSGTIGQEHSASKY